MFHIFKILFFDLYTALQYVCIIYGILIGWAGFQLGREFHPTSMLMKLLCVVFCPIALVLLYFFVFYRLFDGDMSAVLGIFTPLFLGFLTMGVVGYIKVKVKEKDDEEDEENEDEG